MDLISGNETGFRPRRGRGGRRFLQGEILLAGVLWTLPGGSRAQDSTAEYEVKAAFLYNFAVHVEWPAAAFKEGEPIVIAILGKDPFGGALDRAIRGKTAQGRTMEWSGVARVEDMKSCPILFITDGEKETLARAAEALKGGHALIVAESPGLARKGAALNFVIEEKRVRLEANLEAAKQAGLKIGSKLLKVARIVDSPGK